MRAASTWPIALVLAGCGRVGFSPLGDGDGRPNTLDDGAIIGGDGPLAAGCPANYTGSFTGTFGSSWYRMEGQVFDWITAEAICEADGSNAHLAVIDSQEELDAIANITGRIRNWTGVTQRIAPGTWLRITGGEATFLPWEAGFPVGAGGADCVEFVENFPTLEITYQNTPCNMQLTPFCECDHVAPDPSTF